MPPITDLIPSPNIFQHPDTYELENLALDRGGRIEAAMRAVRDWAGAEVADIGCGTGFHLPRFARTAARVSGVEPHPPLRARALARVRASPNVRVLAGSAAALPLADASVDVAHARFAYFFGPGCEAGLAELDRVMRRGAAAFLIDNDSASSTFGRWFARSVPGRDQRAVDRFFHRHGFECERLLVHAEFEHRADFEAVVGIEFAPALAADILAEHRGTAVDYSVALRYRRW